MPDLGAADRGGALETERVHQERWYARAIADDFFAREGFRRLVAWNLRALQTAVPLGPELRLLSLGCGLGDYELALAPIVRAIVAIDLSETAIIEAQRRASAARIANVEFRCAAIDELEFPAGSFDLVYGLGVLHHLAAAGRHRLFRAAHGWLAENGWIYTRDPNARSLLRIAGRRLCRTPRSVHSPGERDLDPRQVGRELEAAGFHHASVTYTDVLGGPLPWLVTIGSSRFWTAVFAVDRLWLSIPGLRQHATQFSITARR